MCSHLRIHFPIQQKGNVLRKVANYRKLNYMGLGDAEPRCVVAVQRTDTLRVCMNCLWHTRTGNLALPPSSPTFSREEVTSLLTEILN